MPNIINPFGTSTLRISGWVNAFGGKALFEDWVGKAEVGPNSTVESVVPRSNVIMAPAKLPGVGRENAGCEAGSVSAGEEGDG